MCAIGPTVGRGRGTSSPGNAVTPNTSASPAADRPSFREKTLSRLVGHARALLPAGAVTFVTVRHGAVEHTTGWFVGTLSRALVPEDLVSAVHEEITDWSGGLGDDPVALALRRHGRPEAAGSAGCAG
jgi:hypothetical protein